MERSAFCDFPSQPDITLEDPELEQVEDCVRRIWSLWILLLCMTFGPVQGLVVAWDIAIALAEPLVLEGVDGRLANIEQSS